MYTVHCTVYTYGYNMYYIRIITNVQNVGTSTMTNVHSISSEICSTPRVYADYPTNFNHSNSHKI